MYKTCMVLFLIQEDPGVREVIPHRHLQSPHTIKYYDLSTSLQSLLSPNIDNRTINDSY